MSGESTPLSLAKIAGMLSWSGNRPGRRLQRYIEGVEERRGVAILLRVGDRLRVTIASLRRECPELFPGTPVKQSLRLTVRKEVEIAIKELVQPQIDRLVEACERLAAALHGSDKT